MPLATTRELLINAGGRGLGAFNVITLEHAEGIVAGAEAADRPVILQLSQNAVGFHRGQIRPITAGMREIASAAGVPVSLHLDHVEDLELLQQSADAGFSSVMYDAGRLPYEQNVSSTADAATWAHEHGLLIEAELGYVGGKATQSAHTPGVRTDPQQAAEFVAATGVDALAVAVGSSHAMTSRDAVLDTDLISSLRDAVGVPLVLHGSSGVPDDVLREAVRSGMVKINVGTILNVVYTGAVREWLAGSDAVDVRKYIAPARAAVADVVHHLLIVIDG